LINSFFFLYDFRSKENGVSALEQHKKDLADLATVDPEFYKFLKKEDAGLLDFGVDEDDESIPDDDPEQQVHQLPEQLAEMEPLSDEVFYQKFLLKEK
jgi:hypothetical protein